MYLARIIKKSDPEALGLFEKCLLTYYWELVSLGQYEVDQTLKAQLQTKILAPPRKLEDYTQQEGLSNLLNAFLPSANKENYGALRKTFSLICPTLEFHSAVDQLREKNSLAADYIDYLFGNPKNELKYTLIYTNITPASK
jgi:hypothetical protein